MDPLFSIITVTWNAATVIGPTLESVQRQTSSDYEMLIIDGASTDDTLSIVKRASISALRVFSEPDKGLYDAMNKGIARARGRYLVFLNAGDTVLTSGGRPAEWPQDLTLYAPADGRNFREADDLCGGDAAHDGDDAVGQDPFQYFLGHRCYLLSLRDV